MFDQMEFPIVAYESGSPADRMRAASRAEAQAVAARLNAIWDLYRQRLRAWGKCETWVVGTWTALTAEVSAALRISLAMASAQLRYAKAMCERLLRVGAVLAAGEIDFRLFKAIVYRTDLLTDVRVLSTIDAQLAARVARWSGWTKRRVAREVNRLVAKFDRDASADREGVRSRPLHRQRCAGIGGDQRHAICHGCNSAG
jgi:hypothetical protein